tara:strand:+ start:1070 stop:1723 length:654 start_codon:yes stop_codon:yes gene_type:complete
MKKILVIIIILNSIPNFGQIDKIDSIQRIVFKRANDNLKMSKIDVDYPEIERSYLERAYISYYFCHQKNPENEIGQISLKKSDSLKNIIVANLLRNIQGVWKLKSTGTNWGINSNDKTSEIDKILIVSDGKIEFYDENKKSKKRTLIKTENIKFLENIKYRGPTTSELIFSDNQFWSIGFNKSKDIVYFTNTGEFLENGEVSEFVCGNSQMIYERIK